MILLRLAKRRLRDVWQPPVEEANLKEDDRPPQTPSNTRAIKAAAPKVFTSANKHGPITSE